MSGLLESRLKLMAVVDRQVEVSVQRSQVVDVAAGIVQVVRP